MRHLPPPAKSGPHCARASRCTRAACARPVWATWTGRAGCRRRCVVCFALPPLHSLSAQCAPTSLTHPSRYTGLQVSGEAELEAALAVPGRRCTDTLLVRGAAASGRRRRRRRRRRCCCASATAKGHLCRGCAQGGGRREHRQQAAERAQGAIKQHGAVPLHGERRRARRAAAAAERGAAAARLRRRRHGADPLRGGGQRARRRRRPRLQGLHLGHRRDARQWPAGHAGLGPAAARQCAQVRARWAARAACFSACMSIGAARASRRHLARAPLLSPHLHSTLQLGRAGDCSRAGALRRAGR